MIFPALAAALVAIPLPAQFGDWWVACDNGRLCEAIALPTESQSEDDVPSWVLYMERGSASDAAPSVSIGGSYRDDTVAASLVLDGLRTEFRFTSDGDLTGDPVALLSALAVARQAHFIDARGKKVATLSVDGASAGFRWIDDQQKRVGTVTALVARGTKPASSVPPPPPLPRIDQPAAADLPARTLGPAVLAQVRKPFDLCEAEFDPKDVEYHRLDRSHSVAIVPCWLGPYQTDGIIVVIDEQGRWRLANIERTVALDPEQPSIDLHRLISPGYDKERRLLWEEYRGRGINDCGSTASWAWDGQSFRLASYNSLDVCRGATARPSLWRTANDPGEE